MQFLGIRNWDKYQADDKGKVRGGPSPWVKDWTDKEADRLYMKLTVFQRYILDGCRRLRGKLGKNIPNDPMYIARALQVLPTERARVVNAIATLTERLFLVQSNQEVDSIDIDKEEDIDKEKESTKSISAAPAKQPKKPKAVRTETSSVLKAVMLLPLNNGDEFPIPEEDFEFWKKSYPAVDVMQELRAMGAWCHANPNKRKTKTGVKAFVNRWLAKAQNNPKAAQSFREGTNGQPKSEQREQRNDAKYARIEQRIAGVSEGIGTALPSGTGGSGNRDVDSRPKLLSLGRGAGSG